MYIRRNFLWSTKPIGFILLYYFFRLLLFFLFIACITSCKITTCQLRMGKQTILHLKATHSHFFQQSFGMHNTTWNECCALWIKITTNRYIINHIVLHVWWNTSICWTQIETSTFNWKWKTKTFYNRIIYIRVVSEF